MEVQEPTEEFRSTVMWRAGSADEHRFATGFEKFLKFFFQLSFGDFRVTMGCSHTAYIDYNSMDRWWDSEEEAEEFSKFYGDCGSGNAVSNGIEETNIYCDRIS